ncbi:MAG: TIGR02217 family protein, partial [Hyphomicrobiales bacterium]
ERNSRWAHSRRRYNAGYGVKSRADMAAVLAFFEERRGRFHSFLWRDALDHAATDEAIGSGDGVTVGFQLTKTYGASFDPYLRPITRPVSGTVVVKVDGVVTDVATEPATGIVAFAEAPAAGAAITASFEFDVPVRFDVDRLDIELTSFDAAEAPSIPLIEVRE